MKMHLCLHVLIILIIGVLAVNSKLHNDEGANFTPAMIFSGDSASFINQQQLLINSQSNLSKEAFHGN
jgi:hypothetical protein